MSINHFQQAQTPNVYEEGHSVWHNNSLLTFTTRDPRVRPSVPRQLKGTDSGETWWFLGFPTGFPKAWKNVIQLKKLNGKSLATQSGSESPFLRSEMKMRCPEKTSEKYVSQQIASIKTLKGGSGHFKRHLWNSWSDFDNNHACKSADEWNKGGKLKSKSQPSKEHLSRTRANSNLRLPPKLDTFWERVQKKPLNRDACDCCLEPQVWLDLLLSVLFVPNLCPKSARTWSLPLSRWGVTVWTEHVSRLQPGQKNGGR